MTLGIMQPYFFPYLGYWQLINAVDTYVVLDDVSFIKQGYINRNYILNNGNKQLLGIKVQKISSNKSIVEHELVEGDRWRRKLLKTIRLSYSKAPFFNDVFPIVEKCILYPEKNLSKYLFYQIKTVSEFLDIETMLLRSSKLEMSHDNLTGQNRIISLCKRFGADTYINAIGGQELYSKTEFEQEDIDLKFLRMEEINYSQGSGNFVPNLSIIDILMYCGAVRTKEVLHNVSLL